MPFDKKISDLEKAIAKNHNDGIGRAVGPLIAALDKIKTGDHRRDLELKTRVARALVQSGEHAVEPLIAALKRREYYVRMFAAKMLGKLGDARAVGPLIAALKYPNQIERIWQKRLSRQDKWMRGSAATALGELGDARAVEPLIAALKDKWVRGSAATALGKLSDARALEPLIAALKDQDKLVRYHAATALGKLRDARALEPLIAALKDQDELARGSAATALGEMGDARALKPLIAALKDQDELVRACAATALGKLRDARALEPLIAALKDQRASAAMALGEMGDARAVEPLIAALKEQDKLVRYHTATALGKLRDARALEPLIAALKDEDEGVRGSAAAALGELGDGRAVEPLIAALKDQSKPMREFATRALKQLGDGRVPLMAALKDEAEATDFEAKEASFMCMLPDRPLTGLEWLASGVIGGAFRPIFRDASALFKNGDVIVRASTDAAVGGTNVVAAKMLINEIAEVRFSPISVDDQVTAAFFRSLVVGGSFLVSVFLIAIFSGKLQLHAQNIVFVIVGCLVVGFLLSFLPAYLKLNKDLIQLLLITANDKVLVLVIEPATKETALRVCDANGLKISDTTVI